MTQGIRDLLSSKKFLAGLVAMVCWIAAHFGYNVDPTTATEMISPLIGFILSQGIADHGKPAAQVTAAAATTIAAGQTPTPAAAPGVAQ